ncbi:unnamed protein product, partial [Sphacelaria rigidula]
FFLQQDDIDSGSSVSTASVNAASASLDAANVTHWVSSEVHIPRDPRVSILVENSSRTTDRGLLLATVDANDTLSFTITISNDGNTWLSAVEVSDTLLEGIDCAPNMSGVDSRFAPTDEDIVCTARVTLTQSMVDAGFVETTIK